MGEEISGKLFYGGSFNENIFSQYFIIEKRDYLPEVKKKIDMLSQIISNYFIGYYSTLNIMYMKYTPISQINHII